MSKPNFLLLLLLLLAGDLSAQFVFDGYSHLAMAPYRDGNKWGYCDTLGNVILKPQYDSTSVFQRSRKDNKLGPALAVVKVKGKTGMLDPQWQMVVPAEFDSLTLFNVYAASETFVKVYKARKQGVYNTSGAVILRPEFAQIDRTDSVFIVEKNGKHGLVALTGRSLTPVEFDRATSAQKYIIVKKAAKFGLYSQAGQRLLNVQFDSIFYTRDIVNDQVGGIVVIDGTRKSILNWQGQLVTIQKQSDDDEAMPMEMIATDNSFGPPAKGDYDEISRFSELNEYFYLAKKGRFFGVVNSSGKTVIPAEYEAIKDVPDGFYNYSFIVKSGNKYGVFNSKGATILPVEFDEITPSSNGVQLKKGNLKGIWLTDTFYPPIAPKYEEIRRCTALPVSSRWQFSLFLVKKDGKYGYVGENGVEYFRN